jgi:mycothiol synthase
MGQPEDIRMDRPHLNDLPAPVIPEGYELVTYRPELFEEWVGLLDRAFPEMAPFDSTKWAAQTVERPQFRPEGTFFARRDGRLVATAFCWLDDPEETKLGRVHWVGAEEGHRGKGLGRLVTVATLHHMAGRGLRRAMLDTQRYRLPAIKLYLSLGFRPTSESDDDRAVWAEVLRELGWTEN